MEIRALRAEDIDGVVAAFAAIGWLGKKRAQFEGYLWEETAGLRVTRFAFLDGIFVGYVNVVWTSTYQPFAEARIPEISDFNVLPEFQRQGIGAALMDEAENVVAERSPVAGIGVGMTADYGAAQRLYVKRGYVPDGRGLTTQERPVVFGETVTIDDGLILFFTKRLQTLD